MLDTRTRPQLRRTLHAPFAFNIEWAAHRQIGTGVSAARILNASTMGSQLQGYLFICKTLCVNRLSESILGLSQIATLVTAGKRSMEMIAAELLELIRQFSVHRAA